MGCRVAVAWLLTGGMLAPAQDAGGALERVRARMRENLARMPDYVCRQAIDRSQRTGAAGAFRPVDLLRVDVAVAGKRELYAWPDSNSMGERDLAAMVGSGVVGTGQFALFARHIFSSGVAHFTPRGEETRDGRRTLRFDYDVPLDASSYRLRVPPLQAVVGFRGSFWADAATFDVMRLEVLADDIPPELGLVEARTAVEYSRVPFGDSSFLLPRRSELLMVSVAGRHSLNRSEFDSCRRYEATATVSFGEQEADRADVPRDTAPVAPPPGLPEGGLLEVALAGEIDPGSAAAGDTIQGLLARPLRHGGRVLAPEGAVVHGRLLAIQRRSLPMQHFVVTLQFHTLEWEGSRAQFAATMEEAASAPGLIREEKRLNPTFSRQRNSELKILVGGRQSGEGVLHWDARHPRIPKGLRTKWRVDGRAQ